MDIEQLKLVLETLQSVGHEAGSLAVLWMWLKFGGTLLHAVFWGGILLGVTHLIGRGFRAMEGDKQAYEFLREMRSVLGTGSGGYLDDTERARTQSLLRQLAEDYRANKGK